MTSEEEREPQLMSTDHILEWLVDSSSFLPSFLDDPYVDSSEISEYQWWNNREQDPIASSDHTLSTITTATTTTSTSTTATASELSNLTAPPAHLSNKKRKEPNTPNSEPSPQGRKPHNQRRRMSETDDSDAVVEEVAVARRSSNRKGSAKSAGNSNSNGNNKDGRWAEQLLNPCASAIGTGNLSRVQHLLFVLHELSSPSGDANHRLAAYGLQALTHYISSTSGTTLPNTFASTETRLFQRSLLKFYEVSPWFTFPNTVANAAILQVIAQEQDRLKNLHILDIGVSHGLQWPTLIEALSRQNGGPPPLIRITIVANTGQDNHSTSTAPTFSLGPPEDDFPSRLLRFAKSINVNLQINLLNDIALQDLDKKVINTSTGENLIVCAQFRLHYLNHTTSPDHRNEFLRMLRSFEPKAVILGENDMDCSCNHCGDFAAGFSRRVEYLWRFLDSTSSAFKGRECQERRVIEGEAAAALTNQAEMNEGKQTWCEKMRGVGFSGEAFGEEVIDGARALLRKYDSHWEMRIDEKDGCVCLNWKGQPVSFSSLWTFDRTHRSVVEER
ncbi:hypothetical protein Syun_011585 [Stephania yunnanensis]|uniref:Nodulation signaling pathway 1-like protein n=1 Tax=Stephania yunnanensis TaxID=152371 RepID=A0AAP0K012_9MAGN